MNTPEMLEDMKSHHKALKEPHNNLIHSGPRQTSKQRQDRLAKWLRSQSPDRLAAQWTYTSRGVY